MQTILPSEFKRQMILMLDGSPHVIEDMHTSGTAQTRHRLHNWLDSLMDCLCLSWPAYLRDTVGRIGVFFHNIYGF